MRTKAIILSAAVLAAGVASSMAQSNVYSLNVVGYVNVTVKPGFSAIANPLDDGAGDILTNVIGADANYDLLPDSSLLYPWTATGYGAPQQYLQTFGWYDAVTGTYSTNKIAPGSGFFLYNSGAATNITFVGTVLQGTNSLPLRAGFNLVSSTFPVALTPGVTNDGLAGTTLQLPVEDSDLIYTYTNGVGYYPYQFLAGYGWYDPNNVNLSTNGPVLPVAQAYFIQKQHTGTWTQSFTVQ